MAQVGVARLGDGVVVVVDHVVEHAHGGAHRALEFLHVEALLADVRGQVERAEVAHRDLLVGGVESDLGAQVGRMHHA